MDEQTDIGGSYRLDTRDGRPALIGDPNGQWVSRGRLQGALRELSALRAQLAECYRLSGADPDGNDDAHLARYAVQEVRRLREEADETSAQLARAERERDDARTERVEALQRIGTLEKALADLIIDANRLCDRGLGGTYEDDCRLSLAKARHVLSPAFHAAPTPAPTAPVESEKPLSNLTSDPMIQACEKCQMRLHENMGTFLPGIRGSMAWRCAACHHIEGASGRMKREEVIRLRKARFEKPATHERCPSCGEVAELGRLMALRRDDGTRECLTCHVRLEAFAVSVAAAPVEER